MVKVAEQKELVQLLTELSKDYRIAAPIMKEERLEYQYVDVDDFDQICLDRQPDRSPKEFFLPQNERLGPEARNRSHSVENSGQESADNTPSDSGNDGYSDSEDERKTLLFGVRSCDIEAIKVLNDVFLDDNYVDTHYKKRWENTLIIGLSCPERQSTCFCDTLDIDPVVNDNVPIYMFKGQDKYWLQVFDSEYEQLVKDLPEGEEEELEALIAARRDLFADSHFSLDLPVPLPKKATFEALFWEDVAEKCLGCGVCTYYCPTCYCFGFFWEDTDEQPEKLRKWDSCMYSSFTKHASGHNPRSTQDQRYRQRIMHKYSYHPENYEGLACTGCGRCIDNCPVNLDIRNVLKRVENYLQKADSPGQEGGVKNGS